MASFATEGVNIVGTGEIAGATSATVMPTVTGKWVKFKAAADNAGKVYIGKAGVTVSDGSTDATTGIPLLAGEWSDWLALGSNNLNELYRICDNSGDDLFYIIYG